MLEKNERIIKNRQYRDTGNIWYTRHRIKKKKMSNTDPTKNRGLTQVLVMGKEQYRPHQKPWVNPGARDG